MPAIFCEMGRYRMAKEPYILRIFYESQEPYMPSNGPCILSEEPYIHTDDGRYGMTSLIGITTHCITLQHTATHCNTLQHSATPCNTLQHTHTFYYTFLMATISRLTRILGLFCKKATHQWLFCGKDPVRSLRIVATPYELLSKRAKPESLPAFPSLSLSLPISFFFATRAGPRGASEDAIYQMSSILY